MAPTRWEHLLGYARVSTTAQDPAPQLHELARAGWPRSPVGCAPGTPEAVWRLDRLGRSVQDLIATVVDLRDAGVAFRSLTEGIGTTTPRGRFVFVIFSGLAKMERELVRERTMAGLAAARDRGRVGGRPGR
jgi:DNA invertase Pin-like site-specific DNA recombinase